MNLLCIKEFSKNFQMILLLKHDYHMQTDDRPVKTNLLLKLLLAISQFH